MKLGSIQVKTMQKVVDVILSGISKFDIVKVVKCTSTKQIWDKLQKIYENRSDGCYSCESGTKETQFVRNLKGGPDKYKRKLPFKCFKCGRKRHFSTECPCAEREYSDDEEESLSKTMETNPDDEENEIIKKKNQKKKNKILKKNSSVP
jgi:hypothetical protein